MIRIRILGRLFYNVVWTRLSAPEGAEAPILLIVDVSDAKNDIPLS